MSPLGILYRECGDVDVQHKLGMGGGNVLPNLDFYIFYKHLALEGISGAVGEYFF